MKKAELRRIIKGKASVLTDSYKSEAGRVITEKVLNGTDYINCTSLFVYISTADEPDTSQILKKAFEDGKKVYVPKCTDSEKMAAVRIHNTNDLIPGMYGIYEPSDCTETAEADSIDLAVIPCLSACSDGTRLGHGKGYYDRFLENTDIRKICLCFSELLSDEIPSDKYDIKADIVITEENYCG